MSLMSIAARVAAGRVGLLRESLDKPATEYSARVEIVFSADFEGTVAKDILVKKIEEELVASLEASVKIVARELRLRATQVRVKPLRLEIAMNDQASVDEEESE